MPVISTANCERAVPKATISVANLAKLFSPANQAITPPSFGTVSVISANALPAKAAAFTDSTLVPAIASEKPLIACPNGTS